MKIEVIKGDITKLTVDAIVNAANTSLLGGGGVDGAIHKAGGYEILEECKKIRNKQGGCNVGDAVYTTGGKLHVKYVIHTVGPTWNNGRSKESTHLTRCYQNSLRIAVELKVRSIAFPNISTGIYRYPKAEAAIIAIETIKQHQPVHLQRIIFVCFDEDNFKIYYDYLNG